MNGCADRMPWKKKKEGGDKEPPPEKKSPPPERRKSRTSAILQKEKVDKESEAEDVVSDPQLLEALTDFYRKHNPSQVQTVEKLCIQFKGREAALCKALENKYGVPVKGSLEHLGVQPPKPEPSVAELEAERQKDAAEEERRRKARQEQGEILQKKQLLVGIRSYGRVHILS